ncbi:hypothetical protein LXT21_37285 [Myxococcus sp. K38C18041901]|uniref:hypothetical protein n=1 Tax=Myxococcus guangdongensis TaxID=2906760 RepID=UPI0020A75D4C|nr:hypothetical protein [Myxococcus guangdongensis]MCP3064443.1 hypothetical protein [Myxococcus guangdongensis]
MRRSALTLLLLLCAACARTSSVVPRRGPPVTVVPPELALESGDSPWAISMPFGLAQDGSALVLRFLERAEASGARFLSNVQVVFVADDAGTSMECRTRLMPEGTIPPWKPLIRTAMAAGEYAPLKLVSRPVPDVVVSCQETWAVTMVPQAMRVSSMDRARPGELLIGGNMVRRPEVRCGPVATMRLLTRYAFEDAVNYVPPRIERMGEHRPELKLQETEAECYPRDPAAPGVNRIEAMAYGGAGPRAALLDGSMPLMEAPRSGPQMDL